ncbi:methyltransferase domain-containing protein [Eikenella sp. S3360]|uniref:Methyltransferase domain-containing protein n=1 Tax=Eikenella glucosivorans TaxID=2766967 RepID=A0ABS0N866_9NEIS|nr:methyltransferase domain-containing protein [Eikenella glucosivorans]MBH5328469.1 methyltransferase domain-containing protein [Eikenella glucosivorans]
MPNTTRTLPADFAAAYRARMAELGFCEKPAAEWDGKAAGFNAKVRRPSAYADTFLSRMDIRPEDTVLDVGCGPGILALRLAPQVRRLYGLDYSPAMLQCLRENAEAAGCRNITPLLLSKEDDWRGRVPVCDSVIASRSGLDGDLAALFAKLSAHALRAVYFSMLVGGRFDYSPVSALLGRSRAPYPDYIYAVNILYQMGYDAEVSFITTPGRLADCTDLDDFLHRMHAAYHPLSPADLRRLTDFFHAEGHRFAQDEFAMKWALISWRTD